MNKDIEFILAAAQQAPSGDNCQPWQVKVEGNKLYLYNLPDKDNSVYNYNQNASYISHGAFIENVVIASSHKGWDVDIDLFPDNGEIHLIAILHILRSKFTNNDNLSRLYKSIFDRHTNRKPYKKEPLSSSIVNKLLEEVSIFKNVKLSIINDTNSISRLANLVAINEKVVLENRNLHKFLFDHIIWNTKNDNKTGMPVGTLELNPIQNFMFSRCRSWNFLEKANKILKLSDLVSKDNSKLYRQSAALCTLSINKFNPSNFIEIGRVLQKIWLVATSIGYSIQPTTGISLLAINIKNDFIRDDISAEHKAMILESYGDIKNIFKILEGEIVFIFRIGISTPSAIRAPRCNVDNIIIT